MLDKKEQRTYVLVITTKCDNECRQCYTSNNKKTLDVLVTSANTVAVNNSKQIPKDMATLAKSPVLRCT